MHFTAERSKFSTRHNTVPFSLIRSTVTVYIRPPKGGYYLETKYKLSISINTIQITSRRSKKTSIS